MIEWTTRNDASQTSEQATRHKRENRLAALHDPVADIFQLLQYFCRRPLQISCHSALSCHRERREGLAEVTVDHVLHDEGREKQGGER